MARAARDASRPRRSAPRRTSRTCTPRRCTARGRHRRRRLQRDAQLAVPRRRRARPLQRDRLGATCEAKGLAPDDRARRRRGAGRRPPRLHRVQLLRDPHRRGAAREGDDAPIEGGDQQISSVSPGCYRAVANPHLPKNAFGWEIDPVGFRMTFRAIYDRYHLPLLVTENGLGAFDELEPTAACTTTTASTTCATTSRRSSGRSATASTCSGYCPWSAIDLVSTHQGISKRYGFVYVDRDDDDLRDLARSPQGQLLLVPGAHRGQRAAGLTRPRRARRSPPRPPCGAPGGERSSSARRRCEGGGAHEGPARSSTTPWCSGSTTRGTELVAARAAARASRLSPGDPVDTALVEKHVRPDRSTTAERLAAFVDEIPLADIEVTRGDRHGRPRNGSATTSPTTCSCRWPTTSSFALRRVARGCRRDRVPAALGGPVPVPRRGRVQPRGRSASSSGGPACGSPRSRPCRSRCTSSTPSSARRTSTVTRRG